MTKKQLKENYLTWNKEITSLDKRKDDLFHKLQELCVEKGDGNRYCSFNKLVEVCVNNGEVYKVLEILSEYYAICGKHEALIDFARLTDNMNI